MQEVGGEGEFVLRVNEGLADVVWPGPCQKLQDAPLVYLDGAINRESAESLVVSVRSHLREPVISVVAVPDDKDYHGVYASLAPVSQQMILTETHRNPTLKFLPADLALAVAGQYHDSVEHVPDFEQAVEQAKAQAGAGGTVLIVGTQSILADAVALWGLSYETI